MKILVADDNKLDSYINGYSFALSRIMIGGFALLYDRQF